MGLTGTTSARRGRGAAAVLLVALLTGGCAGAAAEGSAGTTSPSSQPAASPSPETSETSSSPAPAAIPAPTSAATSASRTAATWPPSVAPEHGGRYWGVYLAVDDGTAPARLTTAADAARQVGYAPAVGDVSCDDGVVEGLRLDPAKTYSAAVLYFPAPEDAQVFVDRFEPGVTGTAQVTTYCLD